MGMLLHLVIVPTLTSIGSWSSRWTGTQDVSAVEVKIGQQDVVLVDTPGFDDTNYSDTEILTRIADWMQDNYDDGLLLSGIIYLHRISDRRMDGASMKNLIMFRKLCGAKNLRNVVLGTTMWENVSEAEGALREQELRDNFWKDMISKGSKVARISTVPVDAVQLVQTLLKNKTMILRIQEELSSGKSLIETEAGTAVQEEIQKLTTQHKKEVVEIMAEMRDAVKARKSLNSHPYTRH